MSIHDIAAGQTSTATTHPGISVALGLLGLFFLYRAADASERGRLACILSFCGLLAGAVALW